MELVKPVWNEVAFPSLRVPTCRFLYPFGISLNRTPCRRLSDSPLLRLSLTRPVSATKIFDAVPVGPAYIIPCDHTKPLSPSMPFLKFSGGGTSS